MAMEAALAKDWNALLPLLSPIDAVDITARSSTVHQRLHLNSSDAAVQGETLLQLACAANQSAIAAALVEHPRCSEIINSRDEVARTALLVAIANSAPGIATMLLRRFWDDIDVNAMDTKGNWPLHMSVMKDLPEISLLLLDHPRIDLNIKSPANTTAFSAACWADEVPVVERMLSMPGLDFATISTTRKRTPFSYACHRGSPQIIRLLLSHDAIWNIDAQDDSGMTGFMWLCYHGLADVADELVDQVDLSLKSHENLTALSYLSRCLHCGSQRDNKALLDLARHILERGGQFQARANECRRECQSVEVNLAELAWYERFDDLEKLLVDGTFRGDINQKYQAVLHMLAMSLVAGDHQHVFLPPRPDLVESLLTKYPNVDLELGQTGGYSALELACVCNQIEIVPILLAAGANLENGGRSVIQDVGAERKDDVNAAAIIAMVRAEEQRRKAYPLHALLGFRRYSALKLAVPLHRSSIDLCDSTGKTVLMLAAEAGLLEIVELLLENGADVDIVQAQPFTDSTPRQGKAITALVLAATLGHVNVVEVLLGHLADIDAAWLIAQSALKRQLTPAQADCLIMLEKEVAFRATSHEYVAKLRSKLQALPDDAPFDEGLFRRAIQAEPSLGRLFLNDCLLVAVYGQRATSSALYSIVQFPEVVKADGAKALLEHVVMKRVLELKWEFFAQRMFVEQLLWYMVLLTSMTVSVTLQPSATATLAADARAAFDLQLRVWAAVVLFSVTGLVTVQLTQPTPLLRLATTLQALSAPGHLDDVGVAKKRVKHLLVVATVMLAGAAYAAVDAFIWSTLPWFTTPISGTTLAQLFVHCLLFVSACYFVRLEYREWAGHPAGYWASDANRWQLGSYLAVLLVYLPWNLGETLGLCLGSLLTLSLWLLSLQFFAVFRTGGYLLPMMSALLRDVYNFGAFFAVVQCAFTCVFYQLFQRRPSSGYASLWQSFRTSYFVMLGEFDLDGTWGEDQTQDLLYHVSYVLLMLHAAIMIVLLLNVLLATMNETVSDGLRASKRDALASYAACILRLEMTLPTETYLHLRYVYAPNGDLQLNPAFHDVLLKAACELCEEDAVVIQSIEETVKDWELTLRQLEATTLRAIEVIREALASANHYATTPFLAPVVDAVLPTATAGVTGIFASLLNKRAPEPMDRWSRVHQLHAHVRDQWQAMASDAAWRDQEDGDAPLLFAMVHGQSVNAVVAAAWATVETAFAEVEARWQTPIEPTLRELQMDVAGTAKVETIAALKAEVATCHATIRELQARHDEAQRQARDATLTLDGKLNRVLALLEATA
ncbi:hypothetical protein ACHHYP_09541 [Achlya hypogyna]|uniref:Ion transport domain-containing protein n=1 Tax=Achlya hypogyna TaxID=1202772 RepID=A0A1V9YN21_ACHHY|nr:hypothetical protein ACHHYP_09541 [Achlya hypogyna]